MRDKTEHKVLAALQGGEWVTTAELAMSGAGNISAVCIALARLENRGFVEVRRFPAAHEGHGDHFLAYAPRREYHISSAGLAYWLEWQCTSTPADRRSAETEKKDE